VQGSIARGNDFLRKSKATKARNDNHLRETGIQVTHSKATRVENPEESEVVMEKAICESNTGARLGGGNETNTV